MHCSVDKMTNKMIREYLKRAEQIIGERTPAEIAYDDEVISHLEKGYPTEAATGPQDPLRGLGHQCATGCATR